MADAYIFKRTERKPDFIGQYIGMEKLLEKLREIGKGNYVVLSSGDALNDLHGSILVISLSGKRTKEEIEKDFNRVFGKYSSFYSIGDARQAYITDCVPITLLGPRDRVGYRG